MSAATLAFVPGVLLGFLADPPPAWLSRLFETLMLVSFVSGIALMLWMLVACIRDRTLTPQERLRWELLLVVGGPITAAVYLLSRPPGHGRG